MCEMFPPENVVLRHYGATACRPSSLIFRKLSSDKFPPEKCCFTALRCHCLHAVLSNTPETSPCEKFPPENAVSVCYATCRLLFCAIATEGINKQWVRSPTSHPGGSHVPMPPARPSQCSFRPALAALFPFCRNGCAKHGRRRTILFGPTRPPTAHGPTFVRQHSVNAL